MKKLFLTLVLFFVITPVSYAQEEPTPTEVVEESAEELDDTIKSLKEKIEDKVEQINKTSRKIIKGIIASADEETIELQTDTENTFTVSLDETISSFFTASLSNQDEIEQGDLEEGDYIIVSGPIIEDQISANIIYKQTQYSVLQGQITATNDSNFTVDVVTPEKDEYTLDIEDDTEQLLMNSKSLELEKAGFAKYKVGDNLHFVIETLKGDDTRASALRTLIIPQEFFTEEDASDATSENDITEPEE